MASREQVRKAFQLIHQRSDFEFFFENLKTVDWLEPLFDEGAFKNPDSPIRHGDTVSFPFWPPSKFLVRVSSQDPKRVLQIIQGIPETENPRIHEDFVEAALAMPPQIAVGLKDRVIRWVDNPYQLLLDQKIAKYVAHLKGGNLKEQALEVASALFNVRSNEETAGKKLELASRRAQPVLRNDWEYNECLKIVSPVFKGADTQDLVRLLADKLELAIQIEDRPTNNEFTDYSHIWRGSIEDSNQNHDHNLKDTLVDWIRNLLEELNGLDPSAAEQVSQNFREKPYPIFSRFVLHLAKTSNNLSFVRSLILDEELFEADDVWHEYAHLIEEKFVMLDPEDQKSLLQLIQTHAPYDKLMKESDPEEIARANRRAKYKYYFMLRKQLTGDTLLYFEELNKEFGTPDHPTFSNYTMSWTGPNSPKSTDELSQLSQDDLVDFLRSWRPPASRGFGPEPSIEGLARELEVLVGKNPSLFLSAIDKFKLPEKTYVRAIIQGLGKPLSEEGQFDWGSALNLLHWASIQSDAGTQEKDEDRDPNWSWARTAACRLLEKGLNSKKQSISFLLRERVWGVIDVALKDEDPDVEREEKYTSDKNYYQMAINSARGVALETALHYVFWVKKNLEKDGQPFSKQSAPEFFTAADLHLDVSKEPSKAVRAVFGRWTPWLKSLDLDWFRASIKLIFPEDPALLDYWASAWRAYMLYSQPYSDIYEELLSVYEKAVRELTPEAKDSSERIDTRLAHHLITFYIIGRTELDSDVISELYKRADQRIKASILDFAGRSLTSEKKDLSQKIIERSKALWEARLEACKKIAKIEDRRELAEFGWWMGTKHFPEEWILDQAVEVLNACRHLTPDHLVMGRLIGLADKHPNRVAEVFKLMVNYKVSDHGFYGWLHKGDVLLRKLLNTEAKSTAIEIIHMLGAYGFRQFGELLKEANK